jgi:hypothetical protein
MEMGSDSSYKDMTLVAPCQPSHCEMSREKLRLRTLYQTWQGLVVVPHGSSNRFHQIGNFWLPGHSAFLYPWHCAPQVSIKAFDRMKTRDMTPGVWEDDAYKGHIFYGPLAESFSGIIRTVPNPVISERGVISGDLDHPVFSLVCSPSIDFSKSPPSYLS